MPTPTHVAFLRAVNVGGRTARKEQLIAAALSTGATDGPLSPAARIDR